MSAPSDILGPDLEGLLREAAADPRSQLLRVPRPARVEGLFERQSVLRPSATGMTNLDRHLLAVHRAELAELLLRACRVIALGDPVVKRKIFRGGCRGSDDETWSNLSESARALLREVGTPAEIGDAVALVVDLAGDVEGTAKPSPTQLARAAHRLEPSSKASAWIGFALATYGQDESAVHLLRNLLELCPRLDVASASLVNLGMALASLGRLQEALEAYRTAFERDPDQTTALIGWAHLAIQAERLEDARTAQRALDAVVRLQSPGVPELLEDYRWRIHRSERGVSAPSRTIARKLASNAGEVSGKVLDVYH